MQVGENILPSFLNEGKQYSSYYKISSQPITHLLMPITVFFNFFKFTCNCGTDQFTSSIYSSIPSWVTPSIQSTLDQKPPERGLSLQLSAQAFWRTINIRLSCVHSFTACASTKEWEQNGGEKTELVYLEAKEQKTGRTQFCVNILMAKKNSLCAGLS